MRLFHKHIFSRERNYIEVFEKRSNGRELIFQSNSDFITIGRSPKSDIRFNDTATSWEHGNILFTENEYVYRHVSKTNSTSIKRHKKQFLLTDTDKVEIPLKNNDQIIIGDHILLVQFTIYSDIAHDSTEPFTRNMKKDEVLNKRKGSITMSNKTKILFLGANPSGSRLKLDEEIKKIQTSLKLAKERDNLELKQEWAVTIDTLIQAILDESPNIVHFSGHGRQGGIILQNEIGTPQLVTAEALADLFKLFKECIKCIVLNSCYSESQAKTIKLHIPHVIGMKAGIPDEAAISFSTGFYKAIGAGKDIPFAFELGIIAIKLYRISGDNVPVLL